VADWSGDDVEARRVRVVETRRHSRSESRQRRGVAGQSCNDKEVHCVGFTAMRRHSESKRWRRRGAEARSGGDAEAWRVGSGDDLEVRSVWMPARWVSAFIS
jgi:hypothetical protein